MSEEINVLVWSEYREARDNKKVKEIYPNGINNYIAQFLSEDKDLNIDTARLDDIEQGLSEEKLNNTDVLIWWGHVAHAEVKDRIVERVYKRVLEGMGIIILHSAHHSKIFKKLMGTSCNLKWRIADEKERLWITSPAHPIVAGIKGEYIELEKEEMYGEFFDIPKPDDIIFTSWFAGGEVFRSGITYKRGQGNIFYFRPGHEEYPTYYNQEIQQVLKNAVRWAYNHFHSDVYYGNKPKKIR